MTPAELVLAKARELQKALAEASRVSPDPGQPERIRTSLHIQFEDGDSWIDLHRVTELYATVVLEVPLGSTFQHSAGEIS